MVGGRLGLNFSKQSWEEIRVFYLNDGPAPDKWRDQACQVKKLNTFYLYLKMSTLELYVCSFFFFKPYKTAVCSTNITATVPAPTQHCTRCIN